MSVFPIDWHEKSLANMGVSLRGHIAEYEERGRRIDKLRQDIARYRLQIERAREMHKAGFDRDRFEPNHP